MVGWRRLLASGTPERSVPLRMWTLAAVVTSVFAVTAHDDFLEYRLTIPILVAAGFAFSYWRMGKRNWWVKVILALLCLYVGWQFLRGVVADPFHTSVPLTILLLWLQTLHSFDVPARRDLLFSLLTSVILMAVAAAFAIDMSFLLYLAAYAFVGVQALVHNAWQATQEAAQTAGGAPAVAVGPGRAPESAAPAPQRGILWTANHLLVMVSLVAAVVFVFTPRFEGLRVTALPFSAQRMLLDLFAGRIMNPAYPQEGGGEGDLRWNPRGYFGFSTTLDLRLRGRLDHTLVMRVRATHQLNWRGLVFDTYTGTGWTISDPQLAQIDGTTMPLAIVHRRDEILSFGARPTRVVQSFYIDVEQPNVVFAAPIAERLYVPAGRVYVDRYGSMRLPDTLKPGIVYSVISRVFVPDAQTLRQHNGEPPAHIAERYLALPEIPYRVRALAEELVSGQPTVYDRVRAVNWHLWTSYRYDLNIPPQRRRGDAVDYFLFDERRGYCEQFASAMTVMLRAVGIPARLVTGYLPGTLNPITGMLEVRNSDAHAWVEVFFAGIGWVEFEPTPGFPDTASLGGPAVRRWVWQDLAALVKARVAAWAEGSPRAAQAIAAAGQAARTGLWVILVLAVGALAASGARRVAGLRASPAPLRPAMDDAYRQMCAMLARRGLRRLPVDTVSEFRRRVEGAADLPEVGVISEAVEAAAYAGREPDDGDLETVRRALDALRYRLRR
jgi:transglutaminase-like putative cysteine protease